MAKLPSSYDPGAIEAELYARWEAKGWFEPRGEGSAYTIILPPPNVTGNLHMGHAFQATLMDILIRAHRMLGDRVLWQPGTDHAGIATQMVVERQLVAQATSRAEIGREAFVRRVWQWRTESGNRIQHQFRRLGASLDWSRELFTLDPGPARAVTETFVCLHRAGLIYRGKRLVNWDSTLETALSDLEVISTEEDGCLWHIRYPFADGEGGLVVATTRPETLLGDVAVAVNPNDSRFAHLLGRRLKLPLLDREIPILADTHVDPAFGTGCVKVTPAHDFNDYAIGERHGLAKINVLGPGGEILDRAEIYPPAPEAEKTFELLPKAYAGLDRFAARERIIADLTRAGLLVDTAKHRLHVPRGDRSGTVVEPRLTDQWFVDLTRTTQADGRDGGRRAITQPAIDAVRDGRIRLFPEGWSKTYFNWLENIQDWCISRQLWWGHRIPAWYGDDDRCYVAHTPEEARRAADAAGYSGPLRQDEDVLDTWFSSALWPLTTLGWPASTPDLEAFYPTNTLVTGFDIIFFWVARMIMMGLYLHGDVPFREVYVHGLIRDEHGQKMSKSKGNVLDPIDLIDGIEPEALVAKRTTGMMQPHLAERVARATRREFPEGIPAFGTDPLRFTFAALASTGRDINFDLGRIGGYRNFCNKLWNATRFILMHVEQPVPAPADATPSDRWIRSALARTVTQVRGYIDTYRFDLAAQALYEFTWSDFCDWYLELVKPRLAADTADATAARHTLITVFEALLRLLHPFMPFITEALWLRVAPLAGCTGDSIMLAPYPTPEEFTPDPVAEAEIAWLRTVVTGLRGTRAELGLDPGRRVPVTVHGADTLTRERIARHGREIAFLTRTNPVRIQPGPAAETSATILVGEVTWAIPLAGLVDTTAELARLDKTLARLETERRRSLAKLENAAFLARAPAEIVAHERRRLGETDAALERYRAQRSRIAALA